MNKDKVIRGLKEVKREKNSFLESDIPDHLRTIYNNEIVVLDNTIQAIQENNIDNLNKTQVLKRLEAIKYERKELLDILTNGELQLKAIKNAIDFIKNKEVKNNE